MTENEMVMERFYNAFQRLDYRTMHSCYSDDVVFSDPAFGLLQGDEVRDMWEMLCKRAKDFKLHYYDIRSEDAEYSTCKWTASYTFSATNRKVINNVKAFMRFRNGKIIEHSDAFSLHRWASQALGFKGWLLGWTGFMQRRVQKNARRSLEKFIGNNHAV